MFGKKTGVAMLIALAGAASAHADLAIGFEASEGYTIGNIVGQNGWLTANNTMRVENGTDAGNGSPNALRLTVGGQAQGTFGIAQAPNPSGELWQSASVDTRIDDNGGGNYFFRGLFFDASNSTTSLAFRVEFDYGGDLFIQSGSTFLNTGVAWGQNVWRGLSFSITDNVLDSTISYSYNGSPLAITTSVPLGTRINILQFGHDNFQAFGSGSFSGSGNPAAGYFDNLNAQIPAPGSAALLALGGLVASRRRRA